ncbi:hypothetical protein ACF0H5_021375 [Mactra antiquata]
MRPKSAPPDKFRTPSPGFRSTTPRLLSVTEDERHLSRKDNDTLEDTVNRFHTTGRILNRLKERRRTEADIIVNEKPAGLLAMELPTKKISHIEMENVVARVCRPTASYNARISSARRINAKDIYVPPRHRERMEYKSLEKERFKGNKVISNKALNSLVNRLSNYDQERRPPESKRSKTADPRDRFGPVISYRWLGMKNC